MKITGLANFKVYESYIQSEHDRIFFYRITPPNLSIMTDQEKRLEIHRLQGVFDALDTPVQLLGMDKTEDFKENKGYYQAISDEYVQYRQAMINKIDSIEVSESSSIQRAYYLVYKPASNEKCKQFEAALNSQMIHYYPVARAELTVILRSFLLREFESFDLYGFDREAEEEAALKRGKQTDVKAFIAEELTRRLMPQSMTFNAHHCVQNNFFRKTILVKNFPAKLSVYCYLSSLSKMKNTTFSMRLSPMTTSLAEAIDRQVNNERSNPLAKKKISEMIKSDMNQSSMAKFYRASQEKNTQAYYVNIFIETYGATEQKLAEECAKIENILKAQHITYDELTYEQQDGFRSVSPLGCDRFQISANNMPTNTLASLYPFSHSSRNDPHGMLLGSTIDGGDMFVDFNMRSSDVTNGNFSLIGIPGMGKSWLMKKILSQLIFFKYNCFVLDPDGEYAEMFRKLGGSVIDCADGRFKLNPLEVRRLKLDQEDMEEEEESETAFSQAKAFFQHLSWLRDFFSILYPEASELQIKSLILITQELYEFMGINEETNLAAKQHADYPTFSNLYSYIETLLDGYQKHPHKLVPESMLKELLLIIHDSCFGSLGFVFNGITNVPNSRMICFDLRDLLNGSETRMQAVIFNIMTYLWGRIIAREKPTCLALDELYLVVNRKNYTIASYLKSFTKRVRKYDAIIGTATQNINDFLDPEIYHVTAPIFNNTCFKFVFFLDSVEHEQAQRLLKLTDGEMNKLSMAVQRHCLLKAGSQSYYMEVGELSYEKELFGKGGGR